MYQLIFMFIVCFNAVSLFGSSITSGYTAYKRIVTESVENDEVFANFRREVPMTKIYEFSMQHLACQFERNIVEMHPNLIPYCGEFEKNDLIGNPVLFSWPELGNISAITLRYIHFLGEIQDLFDLEDGCDIAEIGCGYGGQCSVISRVIDFNSYELIDLDFVLPLMDKYLNKLGISNFNAKTMSDCGVHKSYDLFISNYGISECYKATQDEYFEKVIKHCKRGYVVYNDCRSPKIYTISEFCDKLRGYGFDPKVKEETVQTSHLGTNKLVYWGAKDKS